MARLVFVSKSFLNNSQNYDCKNKKYELGKNRIIDKTDSQYTHTFNYYQMIQTRFVTIKDVDISWL